MSVGITAATLIAGGIGAAGGVASALIGKSASSSAAKQQVDQQNKALEFEKQQYADNKANQEPYIGAGKSSIEQLMAALNSGKFGPGSIGPAPTFTNPTLEDARNSPGYQFAKEQGNLGILRGQSAAGGSFTGGTLKSLAGYNTNLADSTYGNVFNRALQSYGASMGTYQQNLATQAQAFNQLLSPAQLGESAASNTGNAGNQTTAQIAGTLTNIGSANAAGTIGGANAINQGIGSAVNGASLPLYLQYMNQNTGAGGYGSFPQGYNPAPSYNPAPMLPAPSTPSTPWDYAGVG